MWANNNRQQPISRELSNRHQQYTSQSTSWLSDLPLQLIDRLNDLNDNGDYSPNAALFGQQRDFFGSDLQDFSSGRGSGYESEMHYHNQQAGHESPYLAYDTISPFYSQRGSKEFLPLDRRSRSSHRPNCANPYTPTSVIDQSTGFSVVASPNNGECSRETSPPPPTTLAPCRQLPCRTFISTGSCPYNDRCVFLHDPRVLSNRVVMKARLRKSKEDLCQDSLFWPTMPRREVVARLDCRNLPAISQHYIVPHPSGTVGSAREMRNNNAVYSLWSYFLDFLVSDPASVIRIPRLVVPPDAKDIVNRHTGRRRLNLFIAMSRGKSAETSN